MVMKKSQTNLILVFFQSFGWSTVLKYCNSFVTANLFMQYQTLTLIIKKQTTWITRIIRKENIHIKRLKHVLLDYL